MSLEQNKTVIRRLYEADNKKDLSVLDELISPHFYDPTFELRGPESYKQFETLFFKGFPDWHETILDMVAEGDKVWVHFTASGTHKGEWLGIAPTGKKITFTAVQTWRIVGGKIVEKNSVTDMLQAFEQLGLIKYTEKAKQVLPQLFK